MDLRQSPHWARFQESTGWEVEKLAGTYIYQKRLPYVGISIAKIQRYRHLDLNQLIPFLQRERVIYSVLEPISSKDQGYTKYRYFPSTSPYLPTATLRLNLRLSQSKLKSQMAGNLTRILKQPDRSEPTDPDPDEFYDAWKKNSRLWVMKPSHFKALINSFGPRMQLFASRHNSELVSGIVCLTVKTTAYYYQAWTSQKGRDLNAHHHLIWTALGKLKRQGIRHFDFDGIEDMRAPKSSWRGFSTFKRKWGGRVVTYPGAYQRWF
jgi:hypothetical protein